MFILGLIIGHIYYISIYNTRSPKIVNPTPQNSGKVMYKDQTGACYKYKAELVPCPTDTSLVKKWTPME